MAFFRGLFRTPRHSQFTYLPRYYDPKKEELKRRIEEIEKEKGTDSDAMKQRISAGLRRGRGNTSIRRKSVIRSNMVVFITIIVLMAIAAVFTYFYLPDLIKSLNLE